VGFFRKFAIKQVAGERIFGIASVIEQCKRELSGVPKRQWAKAIVEARYDEPSTAEARRALLEQIESHQINDLLHLMIMTLLVEGKLELSAIMQPQVKRDWQQYILDEYGKYGISINEATDHWD
jgi:hypothetical protein